MCDYCGCLTDSFIAALSDEHEQIAAVAGEVAAAHATGDRGSTVAAVDRLLELLIPHAAREEGLLFPELAAAGVGTHTEALAREHDDLDEALTALVAAQDGAWEALPAALDLLRTHIWREDYDVFPAAMQLLDPAAWTRIRNGAGTGTAAA